MSPLMLTLIGSAVFVVFGAVGALKLGEWLDRWQKRRAKNVERRCEPEDESW